MHKFSRIIFTLLGMVVGYTISNLIVTNDILYGFLPQHSMLIDYLTLIILFGLIFYFIFPYLANFLKRSTLRLEAYLRDVSLLTLALQLGGLIIGLIIAFLVSSAFNDFPIPGVHWVITIVIYAVLAYLGWTLPKYRYSEMIHSFNRFKKNTNDSEKEDDLKEEISKSETIVDNGKVLDTSVIIDGRINDIYKTHFIEGSLIIPVYVLNELQLISDSEDDLKRSKGRRGLDIVADLQNDFPDKIIILEEDYKDIKDVDSKLIRTAKDNNYKILTNDYNLNKVATVQGIDILNINELANAVKMVVQPGEILEDITLIKEGKEQDQAVAYLEDGTMIVVEKGKHLIGKTKTVEVTSVLQTSAGRMIFAKPKGI